MQKQRPSRGCRRAPVELSLADIKQLLGRDVQRVAELEDQVQRHAHAAEFHGADVAAVDAHQQRQLSLREAFAATIEHHILPEGLVVALEFLIHYNPRAVMWRNAAHPGEGERLGYFTTAFLTSR